jgi:hypothetical protein
MTEIERSIFVNNETNSLGGESTVINYGRFQNKSFYFVFYSTFWLSKFGVMFKWLINLFISIPQKINSS